jgi:hypothetical protein
LSKWCIITSTNGCDCDIEARYALRIASARSAVIVSPTALGAKFRRTERHAVLGTLVAGEQHGIWWDASPTSTGPT